MLLSDAALCESIQCRKCLEWKSPSLFAVAGRYLQSECKECKKARDREYAAANAEKRRQAARAWVESHPEENKAKSLSWYYANKDRAFATNAATATRRRTRVVEYGLDCGCVRSDMRKRLIAMYGKTCFYCGGAYEHTDHFIPIRQNGLNCLANMVPACKDCNLSKGSKLPRNWKGWNGRYPTLPCPGSDSSK